MEIWNNSSRKKKTSRVKPSTMIFVEVSVKTHCQSYRWIELYHHFCCIPSSLKFADNTIWLELAATTHYKCSNGLLYSKTSMLLTLYSCSIPLLLSRFCCDLSLVLICRRPTCDVVAGCKWQRSAICSSGSPAHLRWIADVLKLAWNANRIGTIFDHFICKEWDCGEKIELLRHTLRPSMVQMMSL